MSKRKKLSKELLYILNSEDSFSPAQAPGLAAWYQPGVGITGTLTASNWADQSGNGRDLAQGTAGNQPIYLPYTGSAYAYLPGVASNYFSTPDSAAFPLVDIDVRVRVALDDWTPSAVMVFVAKSNTVGTRAFEFVIDTAGKLVLIVNGAASNTSTVATGFTDGTAHWIRVTRVSATGAVVFYTASDSVDEPTSWTQLGNALTDTTGDITNDTNSVMVGLQAANTWEAKGKFYRASIYATIDGSTKALDFDPSTFVETSTNGTTATASTGEVWTLNSTGAKPATIVKSPQLLFDGTASTMQALFTLVQPVSIYAVAKAVSWANGDELIEGGVAPGGAGMFQQITSTPTVRMYSGNQAGTVSMTLGTFFILTGVHNSASSALAINNTTQTGLDAGTRDMGGVTLGSDYLMTGNFGNFIVKEVLIFAAAHDAATRLRIQRYLAIKHGIGLPT